MTAYELSRVARAMTEFVSGIAPFSPTEDDTDEDLVNLHASLAGFSAPKDQVPDRGLVGMLRDLCQDVDGALHSRLKADKSEIAGYEVERKGPSYANTWDHSRAAEEIALSAILEETVTADGEIVALSPAKAAHTAASAILRAAHVDYWRVTAGDSVGVQLRKFRERGACTSPAGVIVRKSTKETADGA